MFVDPLLLARLRARLVHARENAPVLTHERQRARFSLFCHLSRHLPFAHPPFFPPLSPFLPPSLWPPWSSGSSYRVAARIVTHKLLSIVGVVTRPIRCFSHSTRTRAALFRADSSRGSVLPMLSSVIRFPSPPPSPFFSLLISFKLLREDGRSSEISIRRRVVCNLMARMRVLSFIRGKEGGGEMNVESVGRGG